MIEDLLLGALNHLLRQSGWARQQLRGFSGRHARFDMSPWRLAFQVTADGLFGPTGEDDVDVTVSLPAETPLVALQGIDRAMAAVHVTGNAEFATALSFVLKNLRWDAEEDLSRLVGDIAAHRIVGTASRLASWQKQAARNLAENAAEYLGEESGLLIPARNLATFRVQLAEFTQALECAEARVNALSPLL
jgi:ubiquinone biosynthesis protein UbiJ